MAESDEAAFLASMKAVNEAEGTYEVENGAGAATESNNTSDEYDPANAVTTVQSLPQNAQEPSVHQTPPSALFNETMSTSTVPNVSSPVLHTPTDPSATQGPEPPSESRSMSRATSSDGSQTFTTDQAPIVPPSGQAGSAKGTITNGDKTRSNMENIAPAADPGDLDSIAVTPTPGPDVTPMLSVQNGDLVPVQTDNISTTNGTTPASGLANLTEAVPNALKDLSAPATIQENAAAAAALPKARLPHDTIGILEDRIKEDPRGDMDAWLSLIGEFRKRSKLDEARAVYERFFAVFPAAVRSPSCFLMLETVR